MSKLMFLIFSLLSLYLLFQRGQAKTAVVCIGIAMLFGIVGDILNYEKRERNEGFYDGWRENTRKRK